MADDRVIKRLIIFLLDSENLVIFSQNVFWIRCLNQITVYRVNNLYIAT